MARTIVNHATTPPSDEPGPAAPGLRRHGTPAIALGALSKKFGSGQTAVHTRSTR